MPLQIYSFGRHTLATSVFQLVRPRFPFCKIDISVTVNLVCDDVVANCEVRNEK